MIRPAIPRDVPDIEACAKEAFRKYIDRIGREPAPMVADFHTLVEQGRVFIFAGEDDLLRGFIVFYPRSDHMHLENIAVHNDAQGQGIGKRLIEYCEHCTREAGLGQVELYTNVRMTENLMLYSHLGYREIARRQEDGFERVYFRKSIQVSKVPEE
ncbi:MAG: GNAT family N-acetyltransferase [Pseudomonadota bacterium]